MNIKNNYSIFMYFNSPNMFYKENNFVVGNVRYT